MVDSPIRHQLTLTDLLRIDHFRGFEAYWAIPYGEETAVGGQWKKGPGADFFDHILKAFDGSLPIIAEDLGVITPAVKALRDNYDLPACVFSSLPLMISGIMIICLIIILKTVSATQALMTTTPPRAGTAKLRPNLRTRCDAI